jgi:beta-galactosidase/beta-glucuronidase
MGGSNSPSALTPPATAPEFPANPEHIKVPFPPESYLSGIQRKQETNLWYRRTFTVPAAWRGKRTLLHFGAVDTQATIYVNNRQVATHIGSYEAFDFDITDFLVPGTNQVVVGAWDNHDGRRASGKNNQPHGVTASPPVSGKLSGSSRSPPFISPALSSRPISIGP